MEPIDTVQEGKVDPGYRRLLECDALGIPRKRMEIGFDWEREREIQHTIAMETLLMKVQTQLLHFPNGIHHKLRGSDRMELARRYVFLNSKYHSEPTDPDDRPIHPFLSPLEQVSNIITPPVYNSTEVFIVHCALGYTRLPCLVETGQVLHSFDTSRALWTHLLRFGSTSRAAGGGGTGRKRNLPFYRFRMGRVVEDGEGGEGAGLPPVVEVGILVE
ncbi:hypothetical protein HDU97_002671 [Phlyctochytrium planicorne]|nr:hypothetical protein HDU97_002671 [Phlyctochytrium planicorne]